jgi:lipoate-protein ligase A
MQRLEKTLPTAAENVALDEALLDWAAEQSADCEVLRIWESKQHMAVAGRSSRITQEIDPAECSRQGIPIIRRSSGGATILAGPGCLMYAVVLSYAKRPELRDITKSHAFMLDRIATALRPLLAANQAIARAGTSDLVLIASEKQSAIRKFSGNSLRVKRTHCLYHGTLLYGFDLPLLASCLRLPPRRPDYRESRSHLDFVQNLPLERQQLVGALDVAWPTTGTLIDVPMQRVRDLVREQFGLAAWNEEFA